MIDSRKDDRDRAPRYQPCPTVHIFQNQGLWYFSTKERSIEGPYYDKLQAMKMMEAYVRVMSSGFAPSKDLSLVPI